MYGFQEEILCAKTELLGKIMKEKKPNTAILKYFMKLIFFAKSMQA